MKVSRIVDISFIGLSFVGIVYIVGDHVMTSRPRRFQREVRVVETEDKENVMYASYMGNEFLPPSLRRGPFGDMDYDYRDR